MRDAGGDAVEVEGVGALRREGGLPAAGGHAAEADGTHVGIARVRHAAASLGIFGSDARIRRLLAMPGAVSSPAVNLLDEIGVYIGIYVVDMEND